jgi:hypothetical protein
VLPFDVFPAQACFSDLPETLALLTTPTFDPTDAREDPPARP